MNLTDEQNEKIFKLAEEGLTSGKIAQKMRIKKSVINEVLGEYANKGLGSKMQDVTAALGLDVVAETIADAVGADDCGCKARAKKLNEAFPNRRLNDLSHEDFSYLEAFLATNATSVNAKDQKELVGIFNRVFNSKRTVSSCGVCVAKMIRDLQVIFEKAKDESK